MVSRSYLPDSTVSTTDCHMDNIPQRISDMLDHFELTLPQYVMLDQIQREPWPVSHAARKAGPLMAGFFKRYSITPPTIAEYETAIESLCNRGLATVVDVNIQMQIIRFVRTLRCYGPTLGIPFIGQLDLTLRGAETCREMSNFRAQAGEIDYYWHSCMDLIYRRNATVILTSTLEFAHRIGLGTHRMIAEPVAIAEWRTNWWHEYPRGFMIQCAPSRD